MDRRTDRGAPDAVQVDEALAADARARLREAGIVPVEPDDRIGVMLAGDERVVAVRRAVNVERRKDYRDPDRALHADLYVTTRRLVCLGQVSIDLPLCHIREAVVASGALRLLVGDGLGLEIRIADPMLLRVEIAAAREAARAAGPDLDAEAPVGGGKVRDPGPP
jgi:hypothetical protein